MSTCTWCGAFHNLNILVTKYKTQNKKNTNKGLPENIDGVDGVAKVQRPSNNDHQS